MDTSEGHCSICLRPWTSTGPHQVSCLGCGHLYGHSCISKWLLRASRCPICSARARIEDIRTIYADKLIAADDSQLESMQLQVLDAQSAKMNAEAVVKQIRRRMHKTSKQARFMRAQLRADRRHTRLRFLCGLLGGTALTAAAIVLPHMFRRFMTTYEDEPSAAPKASVNKQYAKYTSVQLHTQDNFTQLKVQVPGGVVADDVRYGYLIMNTGEMILFHNRPT